MKPKFFSMLLASACALSAGTASAQTPFDDMFRDFTVCDAGFFRNLNRDADAWSKIAPIKSRGDISWFNVPDRNTEGANQVQFNDSSSVAGTPLLAYFDEYSNLGDMGDYFYWGFLVKGQFADVVEKLRPFVHDDRRLRNKDGVWVRTEVKVLNSRWLKIDAPNEAPGRTRTERVLLIEQ
ncbi:MAG: hypothetical protein JSS56_29970, partial [Proteobacteria bacterium]|nr:hypothetical protein [Pseudomonadota bacterium]